MLTSSTISEPAQGERAEWERLWRAYLLFYETNLPDAQYDCTWSRIMSRDGGVRCLMARNEGGHATGLVHFLFHPSAWTPRPVCYLQDLFVSSEQRGAGVGRRLIAAVADAAAEAGSTKVYWLTQQTNLHARALYDQVAHNTGFVRYDLKCDVSERKRS